MPTTRNGRGSRMERPTGSDFVGRECIYGKIALREPPRRRFQALAPSRLPVVTNKGVSWVEREFAVNVSLVDFQMVRLFNSGSRLGTHPYRRIRRSAG